MHVGIFVRSSPVLMQLIVKESESINVMIFAIKDGLKIHFRFLSFKYLPLSHDHVS